MGLEQVASVVISLISPVAVAAVTAFLTSRNARENEMRKLLHEKRLELYMSFYEQVERCLKNRQIVFEQEYFQKIGTYKAKMTLMASENTRKAFDEFFWFIRQKWTDYHKYSLGNDPAFDESRHHTTYDENGNESEWVDVSREELDAFNDEIRRYKKTNKPAKEVIEKYAEEMYQSMRNDLGSNLK